MSDILVVWKASRAFSKACKERSLSATSSRFTLAVDVQVPVGNDGDRELNGLLAQLTIEHCSPVQCNACVALPMLLWVEQANYALFLSTQRGCNHVV